MDKSISRANLVVHLATGTSRLNDVIARSNDYVLAPINIEYLLTSKILETLLLSDYQARAEYMNRMAIGPARKDVRKFFGTSRTDVAVLEGPYVRALIEVKVRVATGRKVVADLKKIVRTLRARHRSYGPAFGAVVFQTQVRASRKFMDDDAVLQRANEIESSVRGAVSAFASNHQDLDFAFDTILSPVAGLNRGEPDYDVGVDGEPTPTTWSSASCVAVYVVTLEPNTPVPSFSELKGIEYLKAKSDWENGNNYDPRTDV